MNWKVVLKGNDSYLEFLSKELIDHNLSIIKDGNEFILKLDEINTLSKYDEVEGRVIELLDSLNSIELLFITFPHKLEYDIYLVREDGTLSSHIDLTKKNTVNKKHLRFSFESLKESEVYNLIKDCNKLINDDNVKDIFHLVNHNFYSWITWYKIIEILQKDDYKPIKKGGCYFREVNRLTYTANSHKAIGVESRHHNDIKPPNKQMTFSEGDTLIRSILLKWLAQKEHEIVDNNLKSRS